MSAVSTVKRALFFLIVTAAHRSQRGRLLKSVCESHKKATCFLTQMKSSSRKVLHNVFEP